jgi:ABC-type molybdate transport system substrate-binding protein
MAIVFAVSSLAAPALAAEPVMIYAAATLKNGLAAESTIHVTIEAIYGPSLCLVKQPENGAPADIFFSADAEWMNEATTRKLVDPVTRVDLLSSNLVLIAPTGQAAATPITPGFPLAKMLGTDDLRCAIAVHDSSGRQIVWLAKDAHVVRRGPISVYKLERIAKSEGVLREDQEIRRFAE